jgi:hypothetical protein
LTINQLKVLMQQSMTRWFKKYRPRLLKISKTRRRKSTKGLAPHFAVLGQRKKSTMTAQGMIMILA